MYVCMYVCMCFLYSTYLEPLPITHIFSEKVHHHLLKQINHFAWRHEVQPLNHFPVQNLISSGNPISM